MPVANKVAFTAIAQAEVTEAQDWYEREVHGLGRRFRAEVRAAIVRIRSNPMQFPAIDGPVRKAILIHFPYSLLFVMRPRERVLVIACFHSSRNPTTWRARI